MPGLYDNTADCTHKQPAASTGHTSGWRCAACNRPKHSMAGRRLALIGGARQYICAQCVTEMAK